MLANRASRSGLSFNGQETMQRAAQVLPLPPARSISEHLGQAQGSRGWGPPQHPSGHHVTISCTCEINEQGPEGIVLPPFIISAAPICKHFPQITFKMYEMSLLVHLTVSE